MFGTRNEIHVFEASSQKEPFGNHSKNVKNQIHELKEEKVYVHRTVIFVQFPFPQSMYFTSNEQKNLGKQTFFKS